MRCSDRAWGLAIALTIQNFWAPPLWKIIILLALPMPLLSLLLARHAKSLYLAMDHYFDPHLR